MTALVSYSSASPRHSERFAQTLRGLAEGAARAAGEVGLEIAWVNASEGFADADAEASARVDAASGVIVLGGADVDPALYGEQPYGAHLDSADAGADRFEAALIRQAIAQGKPVFAICRGAQVLNVALGGTLVQDLGTGVHTRPEPEGAEPESAEPEIPAPGMLEHEVSVAPGSRLAQIVGAGVHTVRSSHHQAVDQPGDGLVVTARAADGVVEAVELPGAWVIGVQWHPEDAGADPAMLRALLADFARAAARPF